jgi:phosphoglycerate kinase
MRINEFPFKGKKAIVRVDFNVPLNDQLEVSDDTRIRATIPTIKKIIEQGGAVILMSHLGRPKSGPEEKYSLKHILPTLTNLVGQEVKFADDCIGDSAKQQSASLKMGEILLLENLRFYKEEEKGDREFAGKLAGLADVYVNDAFGTAHRAHASTTIIAEFFPTAKLFGYVMEEELNSIDKVLHQAEGPFTAILGGAKVSTKITIIETLMDKVDNLIIGGGMMFTFAKATGGQVGSSLVEEDKLDLALDILQKAKEKGVKIYLPTDTIAADSFSNDARTGLYSMYNIPEGWMGLDIGPESIKTFTEVIRSSKTLLWNGPMGVFEFSNFEAGTKAVGLALAEATTQGAYTLVGGGDSVAAVNQFNLADRVSYVSTGGGALLEYIEGHELPGVKAIRG